VENNEETSSGRGRLLWYPHRPLSPTPLFPMSPSDLGTATNFGLLAGSGITNVSAETMITGDVGSSPTPTVTGLTASQVHGTLYTKANAATAQAQVDLTVGYNEAAGAPCGTNLTARTWEV